jgi:hypothetical protein
MHDLTQAMRILVVGGVANLVLSFALGWLLSARRMKSEMEPHRWLLVAHEVSLQEGLMLLGLSFALSFARMPASLATISAWLLVAASAFQDASGIVNWLRRTGDQFKSRSGGWILATVNAVLNTAGLGLVAYGVVAAMA